VFSHRNAKPLRVKPLFNPIRLSLENPLRVNNLNKRKDPDFMEGLLKRGRESWLYSMSQCIYIYIEIWNMEYNKPSN